MFEGILTGGKHSGVFKNADQKHPVKRLLGVKTEQIVNDHANIRQVPASLRGHPAPSEAAFDGDYVCANLAKVASDCSAAASQLKNLVPRMDTQRTYQAMTGAAKVIFARPIVDGTSQLRRKRPAILNLGYDAEEASFRFRSIGVCKLLNRRPTE